MNFVTDFADQAVLLPLLVAGAVLLGLQRHWRLALAWVAALCGVSALVLALKIACYACGWMWPVLDAGAADVRSPSGHVAASSVLYGSLAVLVAAGSRGRARKASASRMRNGHGALPKLRTIVSSAIAAASAGASSGNPGLSSSLAVLANITLLLEPRTYRRAVIVSGEELGPSETKEGRRGGFPLLPFGLDPFRSRPGRPLVGAVPF